MTAWAPPLILAAFLVAVPFCMIFARYLKRRKLFNRSEPFIGPLFTFELIRLARRGLQPRLRSLLVVVLLIGLLFVYSKHLPYNVTLEAIFGESASLPRNAMAKFGESFMVMFLTVQLIAVALLAPVYMAGGIIEEKERKTLEFLQSSPLTNREIVLGKFFARFAFVLVIIFAGLPVLMFTTFFGGVDPERLLAGFVIAIVTAIHLGSYSMMQAVKRSTLSGALFRTYFMLAMMTLFGAICSPCGCFFTASLSPPTAFYLSVVVRDYRFIGGSVSPLWVIVGIFVGFHLLLSIFILRSAMRMLREKITHVKEPENDNEKPALSIDTPLARRALHGEDVLASLKSRGGSESERDAIPAIAPIRDFDWYAEESDKVPPLKDNADPMIWKELHFTARLGRDGKGLQTLLVVLMTMALYPVVLYLIIGLIRDLDEKVWIDRTVNLAVRIVMEIVVFCGPIVVGMRTAACIGGERQKQTMLTLLTLPWSRREILAAKWWSALRWIRTPLVIAGVSIVLGTLLLGIHPFGAVAAGVLFCGFLSFCASVGLMFSVYRSSVMRATIAFIIVWFLSMFGAVFFAANRFPVQFILPVDLWNCLYGWNPMLADGLRPDRHFSISIVQSLVGIGYFALSGLCWRVAVQRFEVEGTGK